MEEGWMKLCIEYEKWRMKYIDVENYMEGIVFHYTSALALENILKNKTLWVTKSDFLNDKTEYMYGIELVNNIFKRHKYKHINNKHITHINEIFKIYLSRSFIFSTSQNCDSVNLWGNYSKNDGYNIGFNLRELFNKSWDKKIYVTGNERLKDGTIKKHFIPRKEQYESISMLPGKVIYDNAIQENIITDIFGFLEHISEMYLFYISDIEETDKQSLDNLESHYNRALNIAISILIDQIKFFKNPIFDQDEEYRIIFDVNHKLDVKKYRQFNGVFIPYIEVVFNEGIKNGGLPINTITIGPKNNLDIASKGLKGFLKSQGYKVASKSKCEDDKKLIIKKSNVPVRY